MATLTLSGNEITDATRTTNTQGDGRAAPDSSFGIWEATTNLCTNGGCEADTLGAAPAAWVSVSATLSVQTAAAKFGTRGMQVVTSNVQANEGAYIGFAGAVGAVTVSAWVQGAAGGTMQLSIFDNGIQRAIGTSVTLTSAWQRITLSSSLVTTTTPLIRILTDVKQSITFLVDGVQIEAKAFVTPYVDTTGAAVTRAAGSVAAPSSYLTEAQGWVAIRARYDTGPTGTNQNLFSVIDSGTGSVNYFYLFNNGTNLSAIQVRNSVTGTSIALANVPAPGVYVTAIMAWTNTGGAGNGTLSLSLNGGAFTTVNRPGAAGGTAWSTTFNIGGQQGTIPLDGDVLWFAAGTGTLTSADAATIAAYGNSDPVANLQYLNGGVAYPTFIWTAVDATYNKGGFDYGFHMERVESYIGGKDISIYSDTTDAAFVYPVGAFYNISSEVESTLVAAAFTPQVGIAGQAYPISSRFLTVPRSPICFDYTSGSRAAGYTAYLREDWVHSFPFTPNSFHWLGLCDYQDKGGLGSFVGYGNSAATSLTAQISTPTAPSSPAQVVLGATVTAGGTYTAGTPTVAFTGGVVATGGTAATAHAVMNAAATAVAAIVIDTQGAYSTAPTGISFTGGTFSVVAAATPITGTGVQFRAITGFLFTYPILIVSSVLVTNGGSGYANGSAVTFTGGTGGGATGHVVVSGGVIQSVVVDTPGSYTVAPTGLTVAGGGTGAAFSVTSQTVQFFGAIDFNMYVPPGFPKDLIYTSTGEPKVRACVQGVAPAWYGFASVDASSYSLDLTLGTLATKTISWSTVLTYLTTTMDQKVGSNSITPNAASATPYMPIPKNGMSSVLIKGINYAIESNLTQTGDTVVIDYQLTNMHTDF